MRDIIAADADAIAAEAGVEVTYTPDGGTAVAGVRIYVGSKPVMQRSNAVGGLNRGNAKSHLERKIVVQVPAADAIATHGSAAVDADKRVVDLKAKDKFAGVPARVAGLAGDDLKTLLVTGIPSRSPCGGWFIAEVSA